MYEGEGHCSMMKNGAMFTKTMKRKSPFLSSLLLLLAFSDSRCHGLVAPSGNAVETGASRRAAFSFVGKTMAAAIAVTSASPRASWAEQMDVDSYLKTGGVSMPMGVSGQGGKMRPETGVILR